MQPRNQLQRANSRALLIVTLIVAALLIAGIITVLVMTRDTTAPGKTQRSNIETTTAGDTPGDAGNPGVASSPNESATITYTDNGFAPDTLTVRRGTTVTILNKSSRNVQLSSNEHPIHRENPEMNTPAIAPGASTSFVAKTSGTHGYHDHLDSSVTGTLNVAE